MMITMMRMMRKMGKLQDQELIGTPNKAQLLR
jgi:hypothetical protein